ncbi:DUF6362 family protein [Endozoicomonas gorgoniicola]|uniref:DUF6362 family protein n=1 Tax=Endozoicomonas gorgoniicola TaxID=1234144 RepID=A0ABT3MVH2_9GAMM|nr:DUF6362 family protein [Endozoicomonas gorgoniicola]MCW7552989.1 DUF6362 family protein [Endozoicomonas gorgoniicola]
MTEDELKYRYREAWVTSRRMSSGINLGHSAYWPEFNPNRWEVYHSDGIKPKRPQPSAESVDRLVECMRWLRWLSEEERKLVWLRASGLPWREIALATGIPRTTVFRHWHKALLQVILRLNR